MEAFRGMVAAPVHSAERFTARVAADTTEVPGLQTSQVPDLQKHCREGEGSQVHTDVQAPVSFGDAGWAVVGDCHMGQTEQLAWKVHATGTTEQGEVPGSPWTGQEHCLQQTSAEIERDVPVSYTHLTLPTICSV